MNLVQLNALFLIVSTLLLAQKERQLSLINFVSGGWGGRGGGRTVIVCNITTLKNNDTLTVKGETPGVKQLCSEGFS